MLCYDVADGDDEFVFTILKRDGEREPTMAKFYTGLCGEWRQSSVFNLFSHSCSFSNITV